MRLLRRLPLMSQALAGFIVLGALVVLAAIGIALGFAWAVEVGTKSQT